jgi:Family of unknown function (DUF6263)
MKKTLLFSICFAALYANAQNITLETGRLYKITTNVVTNAESPMGGESKNEITTTSIVKITSAEDNLYKATSTLTRMVMDGEMMGQSMKFDSDKKDDMDGQMGQILGASINKPSALTINKTNGKVTKIAAEDKTEANMGGMMGGNETNSEEAAIFVIPDGKKVGDTWAIATEDGGIKTIKNYVLLSLNENIATISITSTNKGTTTKEANGMSMEMTIDGKAIGTMILDTNTGLVKKLTTDDETTGSIEMMGQSIPLNKKSKITVTFE